MKITVLLPVFNAGEYVSDAIQSILNQTFSDFEFLIIDDGSYDNSEDIVNSFNDKRIRYIKKGHTGLADTLNYGLKITKYDWVARMDADDIAHPDRLKKQIKFINVETENVIIASWAAFFTNSTIGYTIKTPIDNKELIKKLLLHCYINHMTVLYNKNFILSNGGYNENIKVYEDYELWLRLKGKAVFKVIPECLVFVRIRKDSLSRGGTSKKVILGYLNKYYPLAELKNKFVTKEVYKIFGWREYFYGTPKLARKYWTKSISILIKPRILLAFFITFLPIRYIEKFKRSSVKLRLNYIIDNFLGKNEEIKKAFKETLTKIESSREH